MAEFAPNCSNVETKPSSLQAWSEESQLILLLWFFFGPNDIATDLIRLLWIRFRYSEYSNRNNWFLDKGQSAGQAAMICPQIDRRSDRAAFKIKFLKSCLDKVGIVLAMMNRLFWLTISFHKVWWSIVPLTVSRGPMLVAFIEFGHATPFAPSVYSTFFVQVQLWSCSFSSSL